MQLSGHLSKMQVHHHDTVHYQLCLDQHRLDLNPLLGEQIEIRFDGKIHCQHCGRATRKSYSQGYCFPCSQKLAACDMCIVRPERCHYALGTCREPDWGDDHCMQTHVVYLANSSGLKVGITRGTQIPTRWIDQGASSALPIMQVPSRLHSGLVEVLLATQISDRTDWRAMLRGKPEPVDLMAQRDRLLESQLEQLTALKETHGEAAFDLLADASTVSIDYPVLEYPDKIRPLNLDKTATVAGRLLGIKGQYLILDSGVLNIRKFTSYQVSFGY